MKKSWKDYEIYIHKHFKRYFPDASIKHNIKKIGVISKTERQIDIYIEGKIAGFDISIIVDCKYFNKKVTVKEIESFLSFLQDVKANKGILITNEGFSKTAYNRATYDTYDIELRIIKFEELERFQSFFAIPYSGPYCAFIPAPDGWVIDGKPKIPRIVAVLYPLGLTFEEALGKEGFIYVDFIHKNSEYPNLDSLIKRQEENIKKEFPQAKIKYEETVKRKYGKTLLRIADIHEGYKGKEYTGFIEFDEFIIFIVLLAPKKRDLQYRKKLEWILQKLIPGKIIKENNK